MRQPAVAGQFYPLRPEDLKQELGICFEGLEFRERNVFGAVCPHAGYVYSGKVAAHTYAALPKADTYIMIGPNHTGYGSPVSIAQEAWETPLGIVEPDLDLGKGFLGSIANLDELGHRYEHSIEVQLPFLQYRFGKDFKILPICMGMQDEETAVELGKLIAELLSKSDKKVLIIASSDFTHYQPAEVAREADRHMIEAILKMDVSGMYDYLYKKNASVCGYGPIAAMLTASEALGATHGTLLKYANSGDVSGDMDAVVGYAAIIVE
ncbi:MAG: MEMO1 family protein [Methanosarcinaceae archaeon]|nr:MEMO1 family protein [Methanosarcinaceae archaeon]MDD4498262.1 MEMO1 family protein [Methanosarcinaceae archaeon]